MKTQCIVQPWSVNHRDRCASPPDRAACLPHPHGHFLAIGVAFLLSCLSVWPDVVATPSFSPDGGTFNAEKDVVIVCETPEAGVHYTTDGSDPIETSPSVVSGESVHLSTNATLKARAYATDMDPSDIKSAGFTILLGALAIPPAQFDALVDLYHSTDGPNWTNNTNWLTDNTPWFGVTVENGNVIGISLGANHLSGSIPAAIGDLTLLESFTADNNSLSGDIPAVIGNLTILTRLGLGVNLLTGSIPQEIGNMTNLRWLWLDNNSLSGNLPAEIGSLSELLEFSVFNNQLDGTIPTEIGNLILLEYLILAGNQLHGEIPASLANLTNIIALDLGSNQLKASDPELLIYLEAHAPWGGDSQTIEPTHLIVLGGDSTSVILGWEPIAYAWDDGYYEVGISETQGGPYAFDAANRTPDKWASSLQIGGLSPGATCYFVVRTVTLPLWVNQSTLTSDPSNEVSAVVNALGVPKSEYDALVALYVSTDGDNWVDNTNWLTDTAPWFGVDTENGHVVALRLGANHLVGALPAALGNLAGLRRIWLDQNQISGVVPADLGNLVLLESLAISVNQLTGGIPSEIGNLTHLTDLWLDNNYLTDPLPPELGNLTNLQVLQLSNNQLTGSIPEELGGLTNLVRLWMGSNQLTGVIPARLGDLANLESLSFDFNALTGEIPPELGNLSELTDIFLNNNQLTGSIPASLGSLAKLHTLQLSDNQLTGGLPAEFGNLSALRNMWISNNQLSGAIPAELGNLTALESLSLGLNALTGAIPTELGNLTNLTGMWLNRNQLSGPVPDLGALTQVVTLDLSQNALTGSIPAWLSGLSSLLNLELFRNQFSGTIPADLGTMSQLQRLTLSYNHLDGSIPAELSGLHGLTYCSLAGNGLTGAIPAWFATLPNLAGLSLRINKFSGTIPSELGSMTQLTALALSNNQLTGEIPASLANLTNISTVGGLMMEYNCLTAHDPALISYLDAKNPSWALTQTIAPANVHVADAGTGHLSLAWDPINYTGDGGYYEVGRSDTAGGPYAFAPANRTPDKSSNGIEITDLVPGAVIYLVVRTCTPAHGVLNDPLGNQSDLTSGLSTEIGPYEVWVCSLNWTGFTNPDLSAAGDPDGDTLTNRQEFAFGLDPRLGASVNPIARSLSGKQFHYTRRLGTDLSYTVCFSTDLLTWTRDNAAVQTVTDTHGDVATVAVALSSAAVPSGGKLFVRVEAGASE